MGLGIGNYIGIQPYYRTPEIKQAEDVAAQSVQNVQENTAAQVNVQPQEENAAAESAGSLNRPSAIDPSELSLTFHKEESFDYLGSESGLMNLDMEKAISDMKKDSILQDYQYFVGSTMKTVDPEDGMVFKK